MKRLIVAVCIGAGLVSMSGCQMMESAKTGIVNKYNESVLKSDIETECKKYESYGNLVSERDYLAGLLKETPKKEGWNEEIAQMVKRLLGDLESKILKQSYEKKIAEYESKSEWLALVQWLDELLAKSAKPTGWTDEIETFLKSKADAIRTKALAQQIEKACLGYLDKKDVDGLQKYLVGLMQKKPKGWDASIDSLCSQWMAKVTALIVDAENIRVWTAVKKALDSRDFVTARKLTSVAEPYGNEVMVQRATLAFRIALLNAIINPYQGECIMEEIEKKVQEFKSSGDNEGARRYVESYPLVKDEFPTIHQKVAEFRPGLEHLYYIRKTADGFLAKYDSRIEEVMDRRNAAYSEYEEILKLSKAVTDEMMRYHPSEKTAQEFGLAMYEDAQRSMTTEKLNDVIRQCKESILKGL